MVSFSLGIYFSFSVSGLCLFSKVVSLRSLTDKQTLPRKNRKYLVQKAVRWWSELFQMQSLHTQPNSLSPAVKHECLNSSISGRQVCTLTTKYHCFAINRRLFFW